MTASPENGGGWPRGGGKWLLGALAVLAAAGLLAVAERGGREIVSRRLLPTHGAKWIWAAAENGSAAREAPDGPVAFFAVRDFELPARPRQGRLLIQGDAEYMVWINGVPVGANRHYPNAPIDVYEVGGLLEAGRNRLLIEGRGGIAEGGLICSLEVDPPGGPVIGSDDSWQIVRQYLPGLQHPDTPLPAATAPVVVWGSPPMGRWGMPRLAATALNLDQVLHPRRVRWARRVQMDRDGSPWIDLEKAAGEPLPAGKLLTFDWRRPMSGYLGLTFAANGSPLALVFFEEDRMPIPQHRPADLVVVGVPGRNLWIDSLPRRFRFATVVGSEGLRGASVFEVEPAERAAVWEGRPPATGVFGFEPPPLRAPIENEIWRQLKGFPGVTGREAG